MPSSGPAAPGSPRRPQHEGGATWGGARDFRAFTV